MNYPLENLGPERFQFLCQALLAREFPRTQCFPIAQPDGGRDAVHYFSDEAEGKFMVFQVKYSRRPLAETDPHKWLVAIMADEAPKVKTLIPRGASRYCLLTNIPGTAHLDAGSIDALNGILTQQLGVPAFCWWRNDIDRRLDDAWDLKWAYPELMTGPDFLRWIIESGLSEHKERRATAVRSFLRAQYVQDEEVRFKQVELQNKLLDLFIDVPIAFRDPHAERRQQYLYRRAISRAGGGPRSAAAHEYEVDPAQLALDPAGRWRPNDEPSGAATVLLSEPFQRAMPRVVVEGAPGQGKSTITQYICQVHRMRLLNEDDALRAVSTDHATSPTRLPIRVDLRDYATWLGRRDPFDPERTDPPIGWNRQLDSFLAALIAHESGGTTFSTDDLFAFFKISAVLIVFDGLDEVADMTRRHDVVVEINKAVQRLEEIAASLQIVVTSRPAAFANSPGMPHNQYPHLQLLSLNRELIMSYAEKWLHARRLDGAQSAEVRSILKEKLDQPHLRDLARNPMQLTILLSLVNQKGATLPDKRTALYEYYVDLFMSREGGKNAVVRDNQDLLIDIHRYLAYLLHAEAEQGNSHASVPQDRLQKLVEEYLSKEGHDVSLAKELFTAMAERVVALVSRVQGTFEFEVQPLREYFAACHLYYTAPQSSSGKESPGSKPDRFDAMARNFYWLNVTRFYAGCYSKGELPSLVERIAELLNDPGFKTIGYPRTLAATLLGDWVLTQVPRSVTQLVDLIVDHSGLRYVLSPALGRRHRNANNPMLLPPKCGREQLIKKCFEMLRADIQADFASQIVDLLRVNSESKHDLKNAWLEAIDKTTPEQQIVWLERGLNLGILSTISIQEVSRLVSLESAHSDISVLNILYKARRLDYIEQSEETFDLTLEGILDRRITSQPQRRIESALDALCHSIDPNRYSVVFHDRQPIALSEVLGSRMSAAKLTWPPQLATNTESFRNHPLCVDLAKIAEVQSTRPTVEWATDLAPWATLIETGRQFWGDRWSFYVLANTAAGVKAVGEKCPDCPDLFDTATSLTRRARFARMRSGASKWWMSQLASATGTEQRMLALLIALTWTKTSALIEIQEAIDEALLALTPRECKRLVQAVRRASFSTRSEANRGRIDDVAKVSKGLSQRTVVALADRADEKVRTQLHATFFKTPQLRDFVIREFVQRIAVDSPRWGTEEWKPNLKALRQCYEHGATDEPIGIHVAYSRHEPHKMNIDVARQITASPELYPSFLVSCAEERCRLDVASRITPVADIAAKEKWFSW